MKIDRLLSSCLFAAVLTGCSQDATAPPEPAVATRLTANSSTTLVSIGRAPVAEVPAVLVTDQHGAPMANVGVTFAVTGGGGTVTSTSATSTSVTTNSAGVASAGSWTLGKAGTVNSLTVSSGSLPVVTFSATAIAGPPAVLSKLSPDLRVASAGSAVALPPSVAVYDAYQNPISGIPVVFAVVGDEGSLAGAVQTTNASGVARVGEWRLGESPGRNFLQASAPGLSAVTFEALALAPPENPPAFRLTVSAFKVLLYRAQGSPYFQYSPATLELTETSGISSATLVSIEFHVFPGGGNSGSDCTPAETVRGEVIAAGQSRDLARTMSYCVPYAVLRGEDGAEASFSATFADELGRTGQVHASVSLAGCTLGGKVGQIVCQ